MKSGLRLSIASVLCFVFTGCAAGKVYVSQSADNHTSCRELGKEMKVDQTKIKNLEDTNHNAKDLRDAALGVIGFAFPPVRILNMIFTVSDSHVADLAELGALKDRQDERSMIYNQKECGL
jgi:hypothetical protein